MGAGKYNRRVQFQSLTRIQDTTGAPVESWLTQFTTWARPKTINGRERWANERTAHTYSVAFEIRYRTDIDESMRALYNGRTLEVATIFDVDERRRELIVLCKEIKNG